MNEPISISVEAPSASAAAFSTVASSGGSPCSFHTANDGSFCKPCCTCGPRSQCKTSKCSCKAASLSCTNCSCPSCTNTTPPTPEEEDRDDASVAVVPPAAPAPPPTREAPPDPKTNPTPSNSDSSRYLQTDADRALDIVFGDHLHHNDGSQLDGGIIDDQVWQNFYSALNRFNPTHYDVPTNKVGQRFLTTLSHLITGIVNRKHNSEKFLVFEMVVLQRNPNIKGNKAICSHLTRKMDLWDNGSYQLLVTECKDDMDSFMRKKRGSSSEEERLQHFSQLLHKGDIRRACRYIAERETGGVLDPSSDDEKAGDCLVLDTLEGLHPEPDRSHSSTAHFPKYNNLPPLVPLELQPGTVEAVARKLHGAGGLGGTDAAALKSWLLRHRQASSVLQEALAKLTTWVANKLVPWAAVRALMSNRLIALDKCPGVRPIGIGQIWRRAMAKLVIAVAGPSAAKAAGTHQLCAGLSAGVEAGVHAANQQWKEHADEDDFNFLQLDASNAFNRQNRAMMLYVVRYKWPAGALFAFNCYKHHSQLVVRMTTTTGEATRATLYSKTGVTQGDPLAMILYGLGLLPLIKKLKGSFADLKHLWFADDGQAGGPIRTLEEYFKLVRRIGPYYGYFLNPRKCVIITKPTAPAKATAGRIFRKHHIHPENITFGHRYLGGFIGVDSSMEDYVRQKVHHWTAAIGRFARASSTCPQEAYCALVKSLQMEWQYLQRVVLCSPDLFAPLEEALVQHFFPSLFGLPDGPALRELRSVFSLPRKAAGLGVMDPVLTKESNFHTSSEATGYLCSYLNGGEATPFCLKTHRETVRNASMAHRAATASTAKATLDTVLTSLDPKLQRIIERAKLTGQWLSVTPTFAAQTILSPQEFRDGLCLRYGLHPLCLPSHCDGCGVPFSLDHALTCKKGGLVLIRHNELRDELAALAINAFAPSAVRLEPAIDIAQSSAAPAPTVDHTTTIPTSPTPVAPPAPPSAERGDLLVRGLQHPQTDTIIDFRVSHLDCQSYLGQDSTAMLRTQENSKNRKYRSKCRRQRRDFVPFVASCDGMLGPHAKCVLQRLSSKLADKWSRPYSSVSGYVFSRISLSLVRSSSLCIRGSRIPSQLMSSTRYSYDEAEGLYALFQH